MSDDLQFVVHLGVAALQSGNWTSAIFQFQSILKKDPDHEEGLYYLGVALLSSGRIAEAVEPLDRLADRQQGNNAHVLNALGSALAGSGEFGRAEYVLRRALQLAPDMAEAQLRLGNVLCLQRRIAEGITAFEQALALRPDLLDAQNNLGNALLEIGKTDEAIEAYRKTLLGAPQHPLALTNLPRALQAAGRMEEAEEAFLQLVAAQPLNGSGWNGLGLLLRDLDRPTEAAQVLEKAATLDNEHEAEIRTNLGKVLHEMGQYTQAADQWRRALQKSPNHPPALSLLFSELRAACAWEESEVMAARFHSLIAARADELLPFPLIFTDTTPAEQLQAAEVFAGRTFSSIRPDGFRHEKRPGKPLAIGYLSADFREHATAYLMAEVLELHDREQVRVVAFSTGRNDHSPMRERLEKACDSFIDLTAMSNLQAAQSIHDAGIDILVDLKGYTDGQRLAIAAHRPAPVQVSWLGYPATSGAGFIDYVIADSVVVPAGQENFWSEAVVRLPHCYQPNDRTRPRGLCL